jgi:endonuclease/exonuclease/phosphatase family metal-dependent hydrolase
MTLAQDATSEGHPFRLLTCNVWGVGGDWNLRRAALVSGVEQLAPDLVLFQESVLTDSYDQAADILGSDFQIVHSSTREADGMGIAIGSRWRVSSSRELDLKIASPRTGEFACTTLVVEVAAPAPIGPLLVVNHFPDYQVNHEYERERQTVIAARAIEAECAGRAVHVVLGGDLDAEPDSASLQFLAGKRSIDGMSVCYRNAWEITHAGERAATFSPANPNVPGDWPFQWIDHLFIRTGPDGRPTLRVRACELAFDEPIGNVWASDHFGLVADLEPA